MSLNGTVWTPIGPSPISENSTQDNGLVTCIAIHPFNQNIIYIGTAGGGVWRSRDGGGTWTPLFDRQLALGIGEPGALAIDPNNTDVIYAGTSQRVILGTGNSAFFGPRDSSQGLYKSTDAGNSWIQIGSGFPAGNTGNALNVFLGRDINVIIVDPADSSGKTLYLAAINGLFWSIDGGQNWTAGNNAAGDARSLALDTSSPAGARILYTGITGRGAFQSTDGGRNWKQILSKSTPAVAAAIVAPTTAFSKVIIAIPPPTSPPSPAGVQVLYATLSGTGGPGAQDPIGVFLSTDQGGTWTQQTATGMPTNTQGGYSFHMAVDPGSPGDGINDIIYFGDVSQAKSINSGNSFAVMSGLHPDTHAWAFFPQASPPSTVYCGCDGGIDTSTDGGGTWKSLNKGGLQSCLFYNIDLRPDATASVTVGALQDNELESTKGSPGLGWVGSTGGPSPGFADGWDVAYDGAIPSQVYCSSGAWFPAPCTQVYLSTNDGLTFPTPITPWTTATDVGCYLAPVTTDPTNGGVIYVSGSQNLWQSQTSGAAWRILKNFGRNGNVDVAAANGNNVVIAVGNQVFVSTNALAATVTFTNITRNLPTRNVNRARFDPTDPTVIYAVLGGFNGAGAGQSGHIFRTTVGASSWTDISPTVGALSEQLDLPFSAIALDGSDIPTTIYAGTDLGVLRSIDAGNSWTILDDIHFPRVPVTDLVLNQTAGVLCAATYGRGAFKFLKPTVAAIAINLQDNLDFGVVCAGPVYLTIEVYNVGVTDLVINSVQRLMGSSDFTVLPSPGTPLSIAPGEEVDFTVVFTPAAAIGVETAIIRISSNDPSAPLLDVAATGSKGTGALAAAIVHGGNFGNTCVGSFIDELLTINNTGPCSLSIFSITSSSLDFETPLVLAYPLLVSSGGSIGVTIRFQPTIFGAQAATLTIFSSDPASPATIPVSGAALTPNLALMIADKGDFGKCCIGSLVDKPLILNNSGKCTLSITGITSSSPEFLVPEALSFPITIAAGVSLPIPLRFEPVSFGSKSATIEVSSNELTSPAGITVTGSVPSGTLAVTGSTVFGGVPYCERAQRSVYICNVGECPLHVTSVHLKHKHRHFRLINDPFPATLRPGASLEVVIQYRATEKYPKACELVITCDDPVTPVKHLDVLAYTLWQHFVCDCCDACRKDRCEECRKGCCHQCKHCGGGHHHEDDEEGNGDD